MIGVSSRAPTRLLAALVLVGACANDGAARMGGVDAAVGDGGLSDDADPGAGGDADGSPGIDMAFDLGAPPQDWPLTIRDCTAVDPDAGTCCASALGFEDGSTEHFLPPACCRLALSIPQLVSAPTSCGRGALRLDADFRATDASSRCGQTDQVPDCAYQTGEVSRGVLTSLDLTGLTTSAMVYLDGPALPEQSVDATIFVLGRGGLIQGSGQPLTQLGTWIRVDLTIPDDGTSAGADVRVIGLDVAFHGQAWKGNVTIDEITWKP